MSAPRRIGVRELRQNLSVYIRRVAKGEILEVTDRGRPVARLVPPATGDEWLDAMIAAGRIRPARRPLSELPPPMKLPSHAPMTISDALAEQRAERLP